MPGWEAYARGAAYGVLSVGAVAVGWMWVVPAGVAVGVGAAVGAVGVEYGVVKESATREYECQKKALAHEAGLVRKRAAVWEEKATAWEEKATAWEEKATAMAKAASMGCTIVILLALLLATVLLSLLFQYNLPDSASELDITFAVAITLIMMWTFRLLSVILVLSTVYALYCFLNM